MKKVITTVGTSIFSNYFDVTKDNIISPHYNKIEEKPFSEWQNYKHRIDKVKSKVFQWMKNNNNASAEISSIIKIYEEEKHNLDVYLLSTDTILSALAAELIKEYFKDNKDVTVHFNSDLDVIKGLQVKNRKDFVREGLTNLIRRIDIITSRYYEDIVFNITGGYKGVIPYLTIMAAINNCEIKYIFENSDELITIPKLPIKVDETVFNNYAEYIEKLKEGIGNYTEEKNKHYQIYDNLENSGLVEFDDEIAFLSPIGEIFYSRYKNKFFIFYATDDVFDEIKKQKNIKKILSSNFEANLDSKTEIKNSHFVYDDGNNPYRIFYFKEKDNIYIYKTFENHDEYEKYLNEHKFTNQFKENYIKKANFRKIKK